MRIRRISGAMPPAPIHPVELYGPEKARGVEPLKPPEPEVEPLHPADWNGDAEHRRVEGDLQGTARQAELQGTDKALDPIQMILAASRKAGLTASEVIKLKSHLTSLTAEMLTDEIDYIRGTVLQTSHPSRRLRAYIELTALAATHLQRIPLETLHSILSCVPDKADKLAKPFTAKEAAEAVRALTAMTLMDCTLTVSMLKSVEEDGSRAILVKEIAARKNELANPAINDHFRNMIGLPSYFLGEVQTLASEMLVHTGELKPGKMPAGEIKPVEYLLEGFLTADNQLSPGIYGVCSAAMAQRLHVEGVPASAVGDMVDVMSRMGDEIRNQAGDNPDGLLDPAVYAELRAMQELGELPPSVALRELLDASEPWLQRLRDFAALAVHLERILSHLTNLEK